MLTTVFIFVMLFPPSVSAMTLGSCARIVDDMTNRGCCAEEIVEYMVQVGCKRKSNVYLTNIRISKGEMKRCMKKIDYCTEIQGRWENEEREQLVQQQGDRIHDLQQQILNLKIELDSCIKENILNSESGSESVMVESKPTKSSDDIDFQKDAKSDQVVLKADL